jgi:signal peptidase I
VLRVVAMAALACAGAVALLLLIAVLLLATGTFAVYEIPTSAMEPTLHCGRPAPGCAGDRNDHVLVRGRFVSYGRGDLVVFDAPPRAERRCGFGGTYVKRIVGLPGERVELRLVEGRAYVYVDGERLDEPYVDDARRAMTRGSWSVPDDSYFVLADNRAVSCDSSLWGPLPADDLDGKVVMTSWPPDRISFR